MILALTAAAVLLLCADWSQTRYIAKHPDTCREINVILGPHPTVGSVNVYFAACIGATILAANLLPALWALIAGGLLVSVEAFVVIRNHTLGVRFA